MNMKIDDKNKTKIIAEKLNRILFPIIDLINSTSKIIIVTIIPAKKLCLAGNVSIMNHFKISSTTPFSSLFNPYNL